MWGIKECRALREYRTMGKGVLVEKDMRIK